MQTHGRAKEERGGTEGGKVMAQARKGTTRRHKESDEVRQPRVGGVKGIVILVVIEPWGRNSHAAVWGHLLSHTDKKDAKNSSRSSLPAQACVHLGKLAQQRQIGGAESYDS